MVSTGFRSIRENQIDIVVVFRLLLKKHVAASEFLARVGLPVVLAPELGEFVIGGYRNHDRIDFDLFQIGFLQSLLGVLFQ